MSGKVLGALALAAQLAKTKKGREFIMKTVKEKYKDFTDSQAGKIVDKAFQSLKHNKEGKPFGQFYKDMAKYQQAFKESAKKGIATGAKVTGPPAAILGGAAVYKYKDDIDKLITAISDTTSGTASAKSTSTGGSYGDDRAKKTFKDAFASARADGKKTFMYDGKRYTTDVAEDKKKEAPKSSAPATKKRSNVLSETDASTASSYSRGGMGKKKYANCGASVPGTQKKR